MALVAGLRVAVHTNRVSVARTTIRRATNWAGNVSYPEAAVVLPTSLEHLQDLVHTSSTVRVVGVGHSFVPCMVADPARGGRMISLAELPRYFELDRASSTVTIDGGMTYTELAQRLAGTNLTLENTQSLPHVTVAGAISTGTHGSSGVCPTTGRARLGSQSAQVAAIEVLRPDGDAVWFKRGDPDFDGAVISFGCLGPITKVTLDLVPEYDVLQAIYGTMGPEEHHPIEILLDNFDSLLSEHDSVSVMVDWPRDDVGMVVARTFGPPGVPITPNSDWNGIPLVTDPLPPLLGSGREFPSTCQGTSLNSLFWFLDSFTGEVFGPQPPDELQLEYFVPLSEAKAALSAVREVAAHWGEPWVGQPNERPLLLYCELRVVRGDSLWLSQTTAADGGDTLALAFGLNKAHGTNVATLAALSMEAKLKQFAARPHWAKLHAMEPAAVTALYPENWPRFVELCTAHDPEGKFQNDWARSYFST